MELLKVESGEAPEKDVRLKLLSFEGIVCSREGEKKGSQEIESATWLRAPRR